MTTTTMPRRISTLQYVRASIAIRLGWEPEPQGATPEWAEQLRAALTEPYRSLSPADDITVVVPPARRPVAAIAATPEYSAVDELGPWRPEQHELVAAHIFDALGGAPMRDFDWNRTANEVNA